MESMLLQRNASDATDFSLSPAPNTITFFLLLPPPQIVNLRFYPRR